MGGWRGAAAALNRRVPTRHPAGSSQPLLSKATHAGPGRAGSGRPLVLEPSSDGAALAATPSVSLRAPRALSGREPSKRNCNEASFFTTQLQQSLNGHRFVGIRMNHIFAVESAVVDLRGSTALLRLHSPIVCKLHHRGNIAVFYLSHSGLVFGQMEELEMRLLS